MVTPVTPPASLPLVTSEDCYESTVHTFNVDASSLGLLPGVWPLSLETTLGNGQPLRRDRWDAQGGAVLYRQVYGCITVRIFND